MRISQKRQTTLKLLEDYYFECAPRLEHKVLKLLIYGDLDKTASVQQKHVVSLFSLMKDHDNSLLAATAASKTLIKMLDY
jgi:hypothetical protein